MPISTFLSNGNFWRDAFVTIPSVYNGWSVIAIDVSYGDVTSTSNGSFKVEQRDGSNNVVASASGNITYTHPANFRAGTLSVANNDFNAMLLVGNNSINIKCMDTDNIPGGSQTAAGYSVVLHLAQGTSGGGGA